MDIKTVGVLGCGLMGSGIAQVCATAGFDVTVLEVEQRFLDKGFAGIEKSLAKFAERPVEKGGIPAAQKDAIRARLRGTTSKSDLADCDIVIEAIIENVGEPELPNIEINAEENRVILRGERVTGHVPCEQFHRVERGHGRFSRTFRFTSTCG